MKRGDHLFIGLVSGLLLPFLTLFIFTQLNSNAVSFTNTVNGLYARKVLPHAISLSVIINLLAFFIFIRLQNDKSARGVLGATIIYALLIAALKFL